MPIEPRNVRALPAHAIADAANDLIDERLRAGGLMRFTVPSLSMFPALLPGDRVIVQRMSAQDPRVGDVVLIRPGGAWLAHRLIERRVLAGDTVFFTKGDSCLQADPPWQAIQLAGVVVAVQRNGREVSLVSRRARAANAVLARLSRVQLTLSALRLELPRRAVLKASRILVWAGRVFGAL